MEIWACETVTGNRLAVLPVSGYRWGTGLNGAGNVDATVPLRKLSKRLQGDIKTYVEPGRMSLAAVTDSGEVMEAGPIWKHRYEGSSGDLVLGATGVWSVFDKRKLIVPSWEIGDRVQDTQVVLSGLSLGSIVRRLVADSISRDGGSLPILFPPSVAGSHTRTYPGYELKWLGDALRDLTMVSGGPDVAFQPRVRGDGLGIEWVLRIGDPFLVQVGDDWRWDAGAPFGGVQNIDVDGDATGLAQRAWAIGNGMDDQILIGVAEESSPLTRGYPLLETQTAHTSVTEQDTIDAHAVAAHAVASRPWWTWSMSVNDRSPAVGLYRPGDWATVSIPDSHEYLQAGQYRTRIFSISGDTSHTVKVTLAPTLEAR